MARIRTVKPEFFRHVGLFDTEKKTGLPLRLAFCGLWTACDREGRFDWVPKALKLDALPFDDVDFEAILDALEEEGFIERYIVDGKQYGHVPSWGKHQVINNREQASRIPAPDGTVTRQPRDSHATQGEGKGKEGKGINPTPSAGWESDFETFYQAYPKKKKPDDAAKAWKAKRPPLADVLKALEWQKKSSDWRKDNGQYIPYPATYINSGGWKEQPAHGEGPKQWTEAERAAYNRIASQY